MLLRKIVLVFIVLGLVLVACSEATPTATPVPTDTAVPQPTNTVPPQPTPTQSATPTPPPVSEPILTVENVTIEAADGLMIQGTFYHRAGAAPQPGVILLHMLGSNRQVWADNGFADQLAQNGYAVLAVDMRGHGDSGGERDWESAGDDLLRVWAFLVGQEDVDGGRTAVVGASIGANMALVTAANQPAINTVVLLSPGLDFRGVTTNDQILIYGKRPILIVASEDDSQSAGPSRTLQEMALGEAQLQMYQNAGHGTNMFNVHPELADLIIKWLDQYLMPN